MGSTATGGVVADAGVEAVEAPLGGSGFATAPGGRYAASISCHLLISSSEMLWGRGGSVPRAELCPKAPAWSSCSAFVALSCHISGRVTAGTEHVGQAASTSKRICTIERTAAYC